ncbi:hypothetical protein AB8E98_00995 [Salmonella enterica]
MTNNKLTDKRTIGARIAALLVADSVPLSDAWKALIDDVDSQEPYGYLEVFDFPRTTATLYPEQDRYAKLPLYIAPQSQTDAEWVELQERRKADNQEPAGYHVIRECGKVGCSVATLEEAEKTRDFWNKKWTIRPYFYTAPPAPVVPEECPDELLAFCEQVIDSRITANAKADELWSACRAAMLRGNHRDLSQPTGQQVAEYEKIMLQGSQPVSDRDELPVL